MIDVSVRMPPMTPRIAHAAKNISPHLDLSGDPEVARRELERELAAANEAEVEVLSTLGPISPQVIVDIGAGIGRTAVLLRRLYPDAVQFLYDSDGEPKTYGVRNARGDTWYGDLQTLSDVLDANGSPLHRTIIVDARTRELSSIGAAGLIVSMYAVGYHWQIEDYRTDIYALAVPGTRFVFHLPTREPVPRWGGWSTARYLCQPHVDLVVMTREEQRSMHTRE